MREDDPERERGCIELSDEALLARFTYRKPSPAYPNMSEALRNKFEIAKNLTKETVILNTGESDAKDKGKMAARKAKADDRKPHKAAVESVQEEL